MSGRQFFIETVGCQMNVLDSELAAGALLAAGFSAAASKKTADILLFNTCSVREHAEEKIYSALGRLKHWKEHKPDGVLGVMGCMAQKDAGKIFRRAPHVDLVLGPGQLDRLPELLAEFFDGNADPILAVSENRFGDALDAEIIRDSFRRYDPVRVVEARTSRHQAMVRIMFGCNKFCSYCIVPSVRGPEQCRPADDILREVRQLADSGCVEVTLLGQTVNSYRYRTDKADRSLAWLLEQIDRIEGIRRIRFVSNYPTGMTDELLFAVRDLPTVCPSLHIPAQHGDDAMLRAMRRQYTVAEYKHLIARIRETIPAAAVTSDFIVGFCGETDEQFESMVDLVRWGRFKNSFIFKYSPRSGTRAAEQFLDDVPESVKRWRNNRLLAVQNEISAEENAKFLGRRVEILVEGESKNQKKRHEGAKKTPETPKNPEIPDAPGTPDADAPILVQFGENFPQKTKGLSLAKQGGPMRQWTGRTPCDRIVVFDAPHANIGELMTLEIVRTAPFTLFGAPQPHK